MKLCNLMCTVIFLLPYTRGKILIPECMSLSQLSQAMKILCMQQRTNQTLWNIVVDCHRPITDEFMRSSAEALCPITKHVQDPTDTNYSIAEVYINICGLIDTTEEERQQGLSCLIDGSATTRSHDDEVKVVKETWGENLPCNISQCILNLGYDLGE